MTVLLSFSGELGAQSLPYLSFSPDSSSLLAGREVFECQSDTNRYLIQKFNIEGVQKCLGKSKSEGFNMLIITVLNSTNDVNIYGDKALTNGNLTMPYITNGNDFRDHIQYDYWDNVEWVVDELARQKMYVALYPVAPTIVTDKKMTRAEARVYMNLLCRKLASKSNVVWLIDSRNSPEVWATIAATAHENNPRQLVVDMAEKSFLIERKPTN
jgi:hypothetical protein